MRYFKILLNLQIPLMLPDVFIERVFVFFPDFIFVTLILILQSFVVIVPSSISEDDITHNTT